MNTGLAFPDHAYDYATANFKQGLLEQMVAPEGGRQRINFNYFYSIARLQPQVLRLE
jgi:hypothetical protein